MTHEHTGRVHAEHHGPEHDTELPDATSIPEYPASAVARTLAPPMSEMLPSDTRPDEQYADVAPGWWEASESAHHEPGYGSVKSFWESDD